MKKLCSLLLTSAMLFGLVACAGDAPSGGQQTPGETGGGDETITIAQAMPTLNDTWYVQFANGSKDMADKLGIDLTQVTNPGDAVWDPQAQIGIIENLIALSPDVIEIDPTSTDGINSAVDEARSMGIPVVMSGTRVSTEVDCSIVADNYQGGQLCGEEMGKLLNGSGKIIVLDATPGRDVMDARVDGFKDALSAYPDIEIVAEQSADSTRAGGLTVMENLLQANPDIDGVWAANDEMALGAVEALREVGLVGKVVVGGFNATDDAINSMLAGEMTFSADQIPYEEGVRCIAISFMIAKGLELPATDIELPMSMVNLDNVEEYANNKTTLDAETMERVIEEYGLSDYVN